MGWSLKITAGLEWNFLVVLIKTLAMFIS